MSPNCYNSIIMYSIWEKIRLRFTTTYHIMWSDSPRVLISIENIVFCNVIHFISYRTPIHHTNSASTWKMTNTPTTKIARKFVKATRLKAATPSSILMVSFAPWPTQPIQKKVSKPKWYANRPISLSRFQHQLPKIRCEAISSRASWANRPVVNIVLRQDHNSHSNCVNPASSSSSNSINTNKSVNNNNNYVYYQMPMSLRKRLTNDTHLNGYYIFIYKMKFLSNFAPAWA